MEEEEEEEDKKREREYFCRRANTRPRLLKKNMIKLCIWVPILREERSEEVGP